MGGLFVETLAACWAGWLGPQNIGKGPVPGSMGRNRMRWLLAYRQQLAEVHYLLAPHSPTPSSGDRPEVTEVVYFLLFVLSVHSTVNSFKVIPKGVRPFELY